MYTPTPVDTSNIHLPEQLLAEAELKIQKLEQADAPAAPARNTHDDAEFSLI